MAPRSNSADRIHVINVPCRGVQALNRYVRVKSMAAGEAVNTYAKTNSTAFSGLSRGARAG